MSFMRKRKTKEEYEKGITSIVAVVLLIAIAVVAGISVYFWMSGVTTKQPVPETPTPIVANPLPGGKVLIANLGQRLINASSLRPSDPNLRISCESEIISPGEQVLCNITGSPSSNTIAIYGEEIGSTIIHMTNETGREEVPDNPPEILNISDDGYGKNLINETLHINATVTDDHGISTVLLEYEDPSGSRTNTTMTFLVNYTNNYTYTANITSSYVGNLTYRVWVKDTANQWTKSDWRSVEYVEPGLADTPWPMFHHDLRHTGLSPYDTSNFAGRGKWSFLTGGAVESSPAIDTDGTVYVGSLDHNLYAINPDGTLKWKFETGGYVEDSSPAIGSDGTIYIGSDDGYLYAINPSGSLKWKFGTGGKIISSPAIGPNGTIFVGSNDHNFYAIYPNGTLKWKVTAQDCVKSSPAIGPDGTIYFGSFDCGNYDNRLYAIYPNGTLKWKYYLGNCGRSSPAIGSDGTVYVGCGDLNFYAIYPNGTLKWKYTAPNGAWLWFEGSPAIDTNGTIYIGADDYNLYAIYPNGTLKWKFRSGDQILSSPAIGADGTIFVGSNDKRVYAIYPNGTLKRAYATGGAISSSPAIGPDGTIYIGSYDKRLYAIH